MTFAQSAESDDDEVVSGVSRLENYSHWRLGIGGGFSMLITERQGTQSDPLKNYRDHFVGAGYFNVGYMFNPSVGLLVEYGFTPISKKEFSAAGDELGIGHEASIKIDIDLLNLFRRLSANEQWSLDFLGGLGAYAFNTPTNSAGEHYYKPSLMLPMGLSVEYCPIPELGISFDATLKYYFDDDINYVIGGSNNDMSLYCGLGLHYNILTEQKDHARFVDMDTYEGTRSSSNVSIEDIENIVKQQKASEEAMQKELDRLNAEIAELQKQQTNTPVVVAAPATDGQDGKDGKDGEDGDYESLQTQINNLKTDIAYIRQTLIMTNGTDENAIFFDFNSARVKPEYELVLARVAKNMLKDKNLKIDLVVTCDKEGDTEYNNTLGQNRANAVLYILVNRYRIDKSRINTRYDGQIKDEFDDFNRRCDIVYK